MDAPIQPDSQITLSEQITRDYAVVRLLGRGGMGDVYLAEQLRVGRRLVALKVLNRACSENPELVRRFENEASSAGRINHRNVVTVYESRVTDDDTLYVAMEFIEGVNLGQLLKAQGALPLKQVVEITRQVCAGLAAAHKLGTVHRDIKPDNIMLAEEDGEQIVKVLDFGIARLAETDTQGKTRAGVVMGTPGYMSPEQAMGKTADQIDARSDVYSLGMVVYQMLCGRTAFAGKTPMEVMRKHISEPPPPPGEHRPDLMIPATVDAVVLKALEKRREDRQQSVMEFAAELEAAASGAVTVSAIGQKDIPTVRIGLEDGEVATSPFSSEKVTIAREPRVTKDNRQFHKRAADEPPKVTASPENVATRQDRDSASTAGQKVVDTHASSGNKKVLLIGGLLSALLLAGVYAVIQITGRTPAVHPVMDFRIVRDTPTAELDTLDESHAVTREDSFQFELKRIGNGEIYLFGKSRSDGYGSWQWLNPSSDDKGRRLSVGEWFKFPDGYSLKLSEPTTAEWYVMVYVPDGAKWSLAEQLRAEAGNAKNGVVTLPDGVVTASLRGSLSSTTTEMKPRVNRDGRKVSFTLSLPDDASQVAVYELKLN